MRQHYNVFDDLKWHFFDLRYVNNLFYWIWNGFFHWDRYFFYDWNDNCFWNGNLDWYWINVIVNIKKYFWALIR
ncbi:unnamed protein product [Leptidea sinapis]|uniref:Uncharacterized protein n=1 Tax=Leptidea sinapis TaxID=189913 RepID=A0A5E4QXB4_9NEOP|nr:unnamed protein product [Leptidea sinapis]